LSYWPGMYLLAITYKPRMMAQYFCPLLYYNSAMSGTTFIGQERS